jgi:hypothetical protein
MPTRLRAPGDAFDLLREKVGGRRSVGRPDDVLLFLGQVSRKARDAVGFHPDAPVRNFDV